MERSRLKRFLRYTPKGFGVPVEMTEAVDTPSGFRYLHKVLSHIRTNEEQTMKQNMHYYLTCTSGMVALTMLIYVGLINLTETPELYRYATFDSITIGVLALAALRREGIATLLLWVVFALFLVQARMIPESTVVLVMVSTSLTVAFAGILAVICSLPKRFSAIYISALVVLLNVTAVIQNTSICITVSLMAWLCFGILHLVPEEKEKDA